MQSLETNPKSRLETKIVRTLEASQKNKKKMPESEQKKKDPVIARNQVGNINKPSC